MNDKLLLHKSVNIHEDHLSFMSFIHPSFEYVKDLNSYDNLHTNGIIFCGKSSDESIEKLNSITDKWVIVDNHHFDVDLTTNDSLLKNLLPVQYIKLRKEDKLKLISTMKYDCLLEQIKACLISNGSIHVDDSEDQSVYLLYNSILGTQDVLNSVFFTTVNKNNATSITSSILTFLNKVQTQNIRGASSHYANLIIQSNKRYGKKIRPAICRFVRSKASKEAALYNLLTDLNKAN